MRSPGINGEGELRGQPANTGSPGKMAIKTECVCVVQYITVKKDGNMGQTCINYHCSSHTEADVMLSL